MPRNMSAAVLQQVQAKQLIPCLFVEIEFEDETVYLWSGLGSLTPAGPAFDPASSFPYGQTFIGMGWLGQIQTIPQLTDIVAGNVTLVLAAPAELMTDAFNAVRQNSQATIWLGMLSPVPGNPAVLGDPVQVFLGALDVPSVHETAEMCTLSITCENPLVDLNRAPSRRFTDVDQQTDYPGDTGFFQVQNLQDYNVVWPAPYGENPNGTEPPAYLTITPGQNAPVVIAVGESLPLVGTVTYSDGSTQINMGPGTPSGHGCDIESSDLSVASVPAGGGAAAVVLGVAPGMAVITAGYVAGRNTGGGSNRPSGRVTASVTVIVTG